MYMFCMSSDKIRSILAKIVEVSKPYKVRKVGTGNSITIPPAWIRLKSWITEGKLVLELIEDDRGLSMIVIRTAGRDEE